MPVLFHFGSSAYPGEVATGSPIRICARNRAIAAPRSARGGLGRLVGRGETVADAELGQQDARPVGIGLDLLAQLAHDDAQVMRIVDVLWTHLNTAYKGTAALPASGARPSGTYTIDDQDVLTMMFRIQRNFLP